MSSQINKLIEVTKKRISILNRNNINNLNSRGDYPTQIFKLRTSKDYHESKINTFRNGDKKQFLFEDQINLRIVPLIKKKKCVFKYENLILKKSPVKKSNNRISTSSGFIPNKSNNKKFLFKSPFQEGKKNKKKLKILVDFSKEIHSPKYKEKKLNQDILRIYLTNNKNERNKYQKIYLKTYSNVKHLFNDIKLNYKVGNSYEKNLNDHKNDEYQKEKIFLKNIINNKERNRRAKNYYNHIHVNKMNKIIERYSFNNYD